MAWIWLLSATVAILAILAPLLYMNLASTFQDRLPTLRNKRICLLIAHPDDEAMFFAPTVLALTKPETGNHVKILCLSSGNATGLGETRKKELVKSALTLGLRQEDDVFIVESPDFQDSMTASWDPHQISSLLCRAFAPHLTSSSPSSASSAPTANIDVLVTFDRDGISSHPNHISLHAGAHSFIRALLRGKHGHASPVDLYTLTSIPFARKYISFLDAPLMALNWYLDGGDNEETASAPPSDEKEGKGGAPHPKSLLFFSELTGNGGVPTAWKAMVNAHKSQMVWFRWGWILFSRYMALNDLRLEHVEPET